MDTGDLVPLSSPRGSTTPSLLLYVDDFLLFCKGTPANLKKILDALIFMVIFQVKGLAGIDLLYILGQLSALEENYLF